MELMESFNPMFLPSKNKPKTIKPRKRPITRAEGRKVRRDKKYPVKIMLTSQQRKAIRILAHKAGVCPTVYCTELLKKGLLREYNYPERDYPSNSQLCFPAKLEEDYRKLLFRYSIKWDCSLKRAAHRIFMTMLDLEMEGATLDELSERL
ncbi:hypothetical protein [Parageobacillus thermoglucosidasius]|uniref:Uncharacterized protein n=1 Tax=Parageobacillus thermoglucosidasius TaxID=1426 RepID=A0AB38R4Q3_PARTM|nr:hypothetical protein [Parageobacillus thermoglucosidasius]UOE78405.1 hypothetical protein IMI45_20115 [Parageobacillus thermoglucosidasius]